MIVYVVLGILAWLILLFFAPESPKWMMIQDRQEDCLHELEKIARFNGSTKPITFLKDIIKITKIEPSFLSKRSKKSKLS